MLPLLLAAAAPLLEQVLPYLPTVWNMEVTSGGALPSSFYHFNLSEIDAGAKFRAEVFAGDCHINGTAVSVGGASVAAFEVNIDGDSGSVDLAEPAPARLADFTAVVTFPDRLGAFGRFNGSWTYAANLVNLATLHVSLFDFGAHASREAILTRFFVPRAQPWYARHGTALSLAAGFALATVALTQGGRLSAWIGGGRAPG
jgi:hypothetical protein